MEEGVPLEVRKGAWTREEDVLLRKCIEQHGEGKWHQIPLRAGLNRCRKSCRLRWLNYLRPNIKRGNFAADEVDLIIRLHKLLGNRWSLIAGRLPERTANDVKNYWNTHLQKKSLTFRQKEEGKAKAQKALEMTKIIRPQPRTFSKTQPWLSTKTTIMDHIRTSDNELTTKPLPIEHNYIQTRDNLPKPFQPSAVGDGGSPWWDNMINVDMEPEIDGGINDVDLWDDENITPAEIVRPASGDDSNQQSKSDWSDIFFNNVDLWDLSPMNKQ